MKSSSIILLLFVGLVACSPAAPKQVASTEAPVAAPQDSAMDEASKAEDWRSEAPKPGPSPNFSTPNIQSGQLKNGLSVYVVERHELPIVAVGLALRAGPGGEKSSQSGIADFTYEMMLEGAAGLDGVGLAEAFADLGTEVSVVTKQDGAVFQTTVLKSNLGPCVELLKKVVTKPTLAAKDFKRKQGERLADLDRLESNPRYLSQISLNQEIYGAAHPYGRPVMGTKGNVEKFKLRDVKRFYKNALIPGEMALILTGDITHQEAMEMAEQMFGKLRKKKSKLTEIAGVPDTRREKISLVARAGLNQTIISMGRPFIKAGHDKEWAYRMASNVFGEMFGSRLNMNLREDKGYTYGARSWIGTNRYLGDMGAYSSVKGDATGAALKEFFSEMEGMVTNAISEKEFEDARESALKSWVGWFDTISGLAAATENLFLRDLPLDRYTKMVEGYKKLTLAEVHQAAKELFIVGNMKVVLVGDPGTVEKQVQELKLGTIEQIDPTQIIK